MLMQNVAVEVRNVPFGEITDYRPAGCRRRPVFRAAGHLGRRRTRAGPPEEITWTPLVRALPATAHAPAADPRLAARAVEASAAATTAQ